MFRVSMFVFSTYLHMVFSTVLCVGYELSVALTAVRALATNQNRRIARDGVARLTECSAHLWLKRKKKHGLRGGESAKVSCSCD